MKPSERAEHYGIDKHSEFTYGLGHSGVGWYVHDGEYPDEGSQFLGDLLQDPAAEQEAFEAGSRAFAYEWEVSDEEIQRAYYDWRSERETE